MIPQIHIAVLRPKYQPLGFKSRKVHVIVQIPPLYPESRFSAAVKIQGRFWLYPKAWEDHLPVTMAQNLRVPVTPDFVDKPSMADRLYPLIGYSAS